MKRMIYATSARELREKAEALINHFFEFRFCRLWHVAGRKFELCLSHTWQTGYYAKPRWRAVSVVSFMAVNRIYDQRLKKALLYIAGKDLDLFKDTFGEILENVYSAETLNCETIIRYCLEHDIDGVDGYRILDNQFVDEDSVCTCEHCYKIFSTSISEDYVVIDDGWFCCEDCARQDGYVLLHNGDWCYRDFACYVQSEGEYYLEEDCYYWERDGECHLEPEPECDEGIYGYHSGPDPEYIACAPGGYTIGFEIEKTESPAEYSHSFDGGFFTHWEEDSSCGYEGISNIFPCGNWEAVEYTMTEGEAWHINNLDTDKTCGGHINISGPKINFHTVSKFIPLVYALFRYRLKNGFCSNGKKAKIRTSEKYSTFREKMNGVIEIRLPSRVHSVEQLKNRYELVSTMVDCIHHNKMFSEYLSMSESILLSMYGGDKEKVERIVTLARYFRDWIENDIAHPDIEEFIY